MKLTINEEQKNTELNGIGQQHINQFNQVKKQEKKKIKNKKIKHKKQH